MFKKSTIQIVHATPEDAKGIGEVFYRTWLDTYPNKEVGITIDDIEDRYKNAFTEEFLAKRKRQLEHPNEGETLLLAKDEDKVIGVCRNTEYPLKNQLQAIYVLPEYQRKGIGKLFWDKAQEIFNPTKDIFVEVATYNTKAIEFYKKLGFVDTGRRFAEFTMKSGAKIPEMEMKIKVQSN